jgi:indole-3-glycerol phosphate synthase
MARARWLAEKEAEVATLGDLALPEIVPSRRDFTQFVATQKQGLALVPRLQRVNPDTGAAWPALDVVRFAERCDAADTAAIAVRTAAVFGMGVADLDAVRAAVSAPLLRDDLCLDRRQIYQARLRGADAVVLPAVELGASALRELAAVAASMHMASVVEVANDAALAAALDLATACIGLSAAGPDGYADRPAIRALAAQVPRRRTVLLLSEVAALDDLLEFNGAIDAAVVGDALLAAADPDAAIDEFLARAG